MNGVVHIRLTHCEHPGANGGMANMQYRKLKFTNSEYGGGIRKIGKARKISPKEERYAIDIDFSMLWLNDCYITSYFMQKKSKKRSCTIYRQFSQNNSSAMTYNDESMKREELTLSKRKQVTEKSNK